MYQWVYIANSHTPIDSWTALVVSFIAGIYTYLCIYKYIYIYIIYI
jgi:hypothetical protein